MAESDMFFSSNAELDKQTESIVTDGEKYNKISQIESIVAGLGSGLIQIPKGLFSLGASLIDLGAGTNKAAQVEKYFDDLTEWHDRDWVDPMCLTVKDIRTSTLDNYFPDSVYNVDFVYTPETSYLMAFNLGRQTAVDIMGARS